MPFLGGGLLGSGLGVSGGNRLIGATWAVDANGRGYNTPSVGAELLTDGGLEDWASSTNLTSWSESIAGTSTINQESSDVHGGTFAARFDIDGSNSNAYIYQYLTIPVGTWVQFSIYAKTDVTPASLKFENTGQLAFAPSNLSVAAAYAAYVATSRYIIANERFYVVRGVASGKSLYFDDASVKALSVPTLLAYVQGTATDTPLARINAIATGTQAGVIGWCDDPGNPQNFVIAIRNGSGIVNLTKCVGGTYTNLISSSVTFVADAAIEIRRPSGNTFQLWYNGSQVGANQAINDSAIADNTAPFFGPFSTYSGNTFTSFSLNGVDIPFPGA